MRDDDGSHDWSGDWSSGWDDEPAPGIAFTQHPAAPTDAELMGLDRNTDEGALVAMAGSLSPAKLSHRLVAWLLLVAFVGPHLLALLQEIF